MTFREVASLLLLAALVPQCASAQGATPIAKVVTLLKGLEEKVTAEGKEEAKAYDKYACFCKEQADGKLYAIEKSKALIEKLTAKIGALTADILKLDTDISKLGNEINDLEDKMDKEQDKRDKEHAAYKAEADDLDSATEACSAALEAMKASKGDLKDAKVDLMQLKSKLKRVAKIGRAPVAAVELLQTLGEQEPPKFAFQGNHIIGLLDGLLKKFKEMKKDMDEEEFEINSVFDKEQLSRTNKKKFAEKEKEEKEKISSAKGEEKMETSEQKDDETNDMNADQSFLDVLTNECQEKSELWDQRSSTRSGELKALNEAIDTLENGAVEEYSANKKLNGFTQLRTISLLQTQSRDIGNALAGKVRVFLEEKAASLKSASLAGLAARAALSEDHFVKVRGLIKDLIAKLEKDAAAEATQKSFCDKGMKEALGKRDQASFDEEKAEGALAKLNSLKEDLESEILSLTKDVAANKKALKEAMELRSEEKLENEETIKTAENGKEATDLALQILSKFYSTAFVQTGGKYVPPKSDRSGKTVGDLAPETFGEDYHGSQSESKGIMGILEVIVSDFDRTVSTTKGDEADAQGKFDLFEKTNTDDTNQKEGAIKDKEGLVVDTEDEILKQETNLKDAVELKSDAAASLEKLKVMCVDGEETWEDRAAKRKKEIEALKEAMTIFEEWQD